MEAETLSISLGGRRIGSGWIARCPAHHDRTPSLSISQSTDGKVLVHCFAGCDQRRVIQELIARGLWGSDIKRQPFSPIYLGSSDLSPGKTYQDRINAALSTWQSSSDAEGTLVQTYLASRGLYLSIPSAIRFHPSLKHPSGDRWPAMVALVTIGIDGSPIAIHRTFLAYDGGGKAPIQPQRMKLGPYGGGAVRLAEPKQVLMVGEGIETCLSAMQATGDAAWAALSTSGLRTLDLPPCISDIIILADGDDAGEKASRIAALRWKRQDRRVRIARPPSGMDFNDLLINAAAIEGTSA